MSRKKVISTRMSKKLSFCGLVGLTSLCILFLVFNQRYNNYIEHRLQPVLSDAEIKTQVEKHEDAFMVFLDRNNFTQLEIREIINLQREIIARDMDNYEYPKGKYGINITKLDDLVMENGGRPIRSVILTSWRSGSTFLGDILNAHPANFYHYEPLLHYGIVQVRSAPISDAAVRHLYALFNCQFHKVEDYITFGRSHLWVFNHNTHLWRQCMSHKKLCWNSQFLSKFCQLFPFQSMKVVRLRLNIAEVLLNDESLDVRLVLLVRDPRGSMQSRKHRNWCPSSPDCSDPARVCADMISDYDSAVQLLKKYPQRFKVIRYEDFSLDPIANAKNLFKFYGLHFHNNVKNFLETHTKSDFGGVSSTFRNSKAAPFHWRNDLEFEEVAEIQSVCSRAMNLWGYVLAVNETHQKTFNPVTNYRLVL